MSEPTKLEAENALFEAGARGDREALSQLARTALAAPSYDGMPYYEALVAAEAFARLAVVHGDAGDQVLLAGILFSRSHVVKRGGDAVRAFDLMGQATDLLEVIVAAGNDEARIMLACALSDLADKGDEHAALRLNSMFSKLEASEAEALGKQVSETLREFATL